MSNLCKQKVKIAEMKPVLTAQIKLCVCLPLQRDMMQLLFSHAMPEMVKGGISVQKENTQFYCFYDQLEDGSCVSTDGSFGPCMIMKTYETL